MAATEKLYSGEILCTHTGRGRIQGPLSIVFSYPYVRWAHKDLQAQYITILLPAIGNTQRRWTVSLDVSDGKRECPQLTEHRSPIAKQPEEQKQLTVFPTYSVCKVKASTEHRS